MAPAVAGKNYAVTIDVALSLVHVFALVTDISKW